MPNNSVNSDGLPSVSFRVKPPVTLGDIHLLALSLKPECPIRSNDGDLEELGMKLYSTLDLIKGSL